MLEASLDDKNDFKVLTISIEDWIVPKKEFTLPQCNTTRINGSYSFVTEETIITKGTF